LKGPKKRGKEDAPLCLGKEKKISRGVDGERKKKKKKEKERHPAKKVLPRQNKKQTAQKGERRLKVEPPFHRYRREETRSRQGKRKGGSPLAYQRKKTEDIERRKGDLRTRGGN